jgi:ATP11 protein
MTLISQFQGRNCLITYLEDYKRDMSSAEPYLTLTLFDELVEQKGLGLIRGEVTNRLSRDEATRCASLCSRSFYSKATPSWTKIA